jgi:hypothetical protein
MGLIEGGYRSQKRSDQKSKSDLDHGSVMTRLSLLALLVTFLLFTTLALSFYADSVNDEALIDWWRTAVWIVCFVGSQISGCLILIHFWG